MTASTPQTASQREELIKALQRSEQIYLRAVVGLAPQQSAIRLNDSSWSILQVAEHLAAAEHGMYRLIETAPEKATATNYDLDAKVSAGGRDRSSKANAPERSLPKGRWATLPEAIEAFKQSRAKTIALAENVEALRRKAITHPLYGEMDGYQCALLMGAHAERHAAQVEEIKRSEQFRRAK